MRTRLALSIAAILFAPLLGCSSTPAISAAQDGAPQDDAAADASADTSADAISDATCDVCLSARLDWEHNGGLAAYYDKSAIEPCNTYQRRRYPNPTDTTPTLSCDSTVRHCGDGDVDASDAIPIEAVASALADADVQAAFAKSPVVYGVDPRAYDGTVLRITMSGKQIEIGTPCNGASGCVDAPAGVTALASLLQELDGNKAMADACPQFGP